MNSPDPAEQGKGPREGPVRYVTANGVTLACRDLGSGYPLVMINGFASTMDMWNPPVLAALARHFRVIVFDNRGTGYSPASARPFSMQLFADDTTALMDALGISRAHVLGLSMGASVAQELALSRPERVASLVLVSGTCGGNEGTGMRPDVWETLSDKRGTVSELAERMFSVLFPQQWLRDHDPLKYCPEVHETTSVENAARHAAAFFSWPGSYDRLPGLRLPVLLMTGMEDVVIPPENSLVLAERITGSWLVRFPGAGHGLMYQYPSQCSEVLMQFLGMEL